MSRLHALIDRLAGTPRVPRPTAAHRDRAHTYPSRHPHGWFQVGTSKGLRAGAVDAVRLLGKELVLFRTESGQAVAMDAYCPHMGAHLGHGGRVRGECLECPFHGWRFDSEAKLTHIPYQDTTPPIQGRRWPVEERYGLLFVWHGPVDAQGAPPYRPGLFPELETDRFLRRGSYAPRDVTMHLLEFAENSVDTGHFARLHGDMRVPWTRARIPGMQVQHEAGWHTDEAQPHVAHFTNQATLMFRGRLIPKSGAFADAALIGPASVVMFRLTIPELGDVLILQTNTPVEAPDAPLQLRVRFTWWSERSVGRVLTSYIVGNWVSQWWQDVLIWENKRHLAKPQLCKNDGPVHNLRRWYQQFYPGEARLVPLGRAAAGE